LSTSSSQDLLHGLKLVCFVAALFLAAFIQALDFSIANVAIPSIAADFGISTHDGTWIITLFAVSLAISLALTGWLVNQFGSRIVLIYATIAFTIASFLCGFAWSYDTLVIFRILQGATAGPLMALPQSMISEYLPESYTRPCLSIILVGMVTAPILGPVLGGYITEEYGWRWVFYINVPFGLLSAFTAMNVLPTQILPKGKVPISYIGVMLLIIGMITQQLFLDRGNQNDWFDSSFIVTLGSIALVALILFFAWDKYSEKPILHTECFADLNFTIASLVLASAMLMINGTLILVPLFTQTQLGYTPFLSGLAIMPLGILPLLIAPFMPMVMKKIDPRLLVSVGFLILAAANFMMSHITPQASIWELMIPRFIQGAGVGFFVLPLQQLALLNISDELVTHATTLFNFVRLTLGGGGLGTALYITAWQRREALHHSNLTELMTPLKEMTKQTYNVMKGYGLEDAKIAYALDFMVTKQAYTIAFDDLFWISAWAMLIAFPAIWLCKPYSSDDAVAIEPTLKSEVIIEQFGTIIGNT